MQRTFLALLPVSVWLATVGIPGAARAEKFSPADAALRVNETLAGEIIQLGGSPGEAAPPADDETYLKRASLDLIGELPTPEEVTAFVLDPLPNKRAGLVGRLVADERFGRNWGRYWRDVILYRRSDERALLTSATLEEYLTQEFNKGTGWDKIAKSFITATGDVRENGNTALIMAQMGEPAETTAEVARIFLGIQIQCAQCHDHPTDRWKRKQFHELAAFFPRIEVRPVPSAEKRSFEVVGVDRQRPFPKRGNQRRGSLEHYMPDKEDPTAQGTLMTPRFFVTGRTVEIGTSDQERRTLLANWIAADSDPWFDRAFVNRIWAEMVGEGFYEPIDDMGPDRQCSAPKTLEVLASQFRANQHNVKWLFQTIAATEMYQRESRSRRNAEQTPFLANCSQRMRPDQLFDSLTTALGISTAGQGGRLRGMGGGYAALAGPRGQFNLAFGFDPSEPRDEVAGSIPQALVLMNSPIINRAIDARRRDTALGKLVAETPDDESVVVELYLRCLAREPKPEELATCLAHVHEAAGRGEAFEDIMWALVNSTEFLHRK